MVSPVLNEQYYSGGFLVSEGPGTISRGVVTFDNTAGAADLLVQAGTVFSYESPTAPVVTPKSGNTGNGTLGAIALNTAPAELGTYTVTLLSATTFSVAAPDGTALANGTVGTDYDDGIGFKLTAGATPYAANDSYTVTLANGVAPVVAAGGANVGNGTLGSVATPIGATVQVGNYTVLFTGATTFTVVAPDGRQLAGGTVGVPYNDEIGFIAAAGTAAWAAGDSVLVGVGVGTGYATFWTGAAPAAGVIFDRTYVPAGGTRKVTAILRQAEVAGEQLQYLNTIGAGGRATAAAQLAAIGVIVRT